MKKKKFSESQIITVLKEYGAGVPAVELVRKYGIGESTIYAWQAKYGDMELSELKCLRQLEDENTRLQEFLVYEQDWQIIKSSISQKLKLILYSH
jgi:putative transposase